MRTFVFCSIVILLGIAVLVVTSGQPLPDQPLYSGAKYEAELRQNPWEMTRPWQCQGSTSEFEWHICHSPEIVMAEKVRRTFKAAELCSSNIESDAVRAYRKATLEQYPLSCEDEKLSGYDEAIRKKYGPIVRIMRQEQGESLPALSPENYAKCRLDKTKKRLENDPQILFEFYYRHCVKLPISQVSW